MPRALHHCRLIVSIVVAGATFAFATSAALADSGSPGMLEATDVPSGLTLVTPPRLIPQVSAFVVDPSACRETLQADQGASGTYIEQFANAAATLRVAESIVVFESAKAAKASYKARITSIKRAIKCGTVEQDVPARPGLTQKVATKKLKVAKVGAASSAAASNIPGVGNSMAIEFLSGPNIVVVSVLGDGLTLKQLEAVARKALKRLG